MKDRVYNIYVIIYEQNRDRFLFSFKIKIYFFYLEKMVANVNLPTHKSLF